MAQIERIDSSIAVGAVFNDVHARAQKLAEKIHAMYGGGGQSSEGNRLVPGYDLYAIQGRSRSVNGGHSRTNIVGVWLDPVELDVLTVTSIHRDDGSGEIVPARVESFRTTERQGDYFMKERGRNGPISIVLEQAGVNRYIKPAPDEQAGSDTVSPETLVGDLGVEASQRLHVVRRGILANVAAIEAVLDHTPARNLFGNRLARKAPPGQN